MKLENKTLFDELMDLADALIENATQLHAEVAEIHKTGNAFERLSCNKKLGEAKGAIDAASKIANFSERLIVK